ncbi:MAG: hypothetical protein IT365_29680, partial [Candidatus Hydrogenedentes bacterium]|nr:hypothetical protein [Candidatus Hydrogenedentota bacterium]
MTAGSQVLEDAAYHVDADAGALALEVADAEWPICLFDGSEYQRRLLASR